MALVAYLVMVFGLVLLVTQGADDDSFLFQNKNTSFPTDIVLGTAAAAAAASVSALVYEEGAYIWDTYTRKHSVNEGAEHPFVFNRNLFPGNFMFGTGSAAYQYEGAYNEDGKGPSIWDTYTHKHPERITDGSNGDVADDHYHRYKEDITLMKDIGLEAYRFSISWPRVLPNGNLSGGVNKKGIKFYNNLINEVLSKGLHPYVTLFHWDVPQGLEDEYGGFLNSQIVQDFKDYADLCFKEFGDRVKYWITLNEPRTFSHRGYDVGTFAPGRCSKYMGNCTSGDSGREPYIVSHYQILAHAAAVKVYREKYQAHQNGKIGITLNCHWMVPISNAGYQRDAAKRAIDFIFGWFMHPLTYGYYPMSMRALVKRRLPKFSEEQSNDVRGSYDFLGLNYYTGFYARYSHTFDPCQPSYHTDSRVSYSSERDNKTIGPPAASSWLHLYPSGLRKLLHYIRRQYKNPTIYITENGVDEFNNSTLSLMEALTDNMRITYFDQHLKFLLRAINEGVDVRGYFFWSFLDNFEWSDGYTVRFGIIYVNYTTLTRSPKHSSIWFRKFLLK